MVAYGRYAGQGTRLYCSTLDDGGRRFRDFPNLSETWNTAAEYIAVFPNVLLGVHRDQAFAILLEPRGPGRTVEHIELYYAAQEMRGPDYADLRRASAELWKKVFEEDLFVCEGMQRGRHGPKFDGGRFSPVMDEPTHVFHHWVASRLADEAHGQTPG